jgi:hypothetical protein
MNKPLDNKFIILLTSRLLQTNKYKYEPEILSIIAIVRSCVKKFLLFTYVLFSCTTDIKFNWI